MRPIQATLIWDNPYGTHAEPGYTPHMGPILVAHMGPILRTHIWMFAGWVFKIQPHKKACVKW